MLWRAAALGLLIGTSTSVWALCGLGIWDLLAPMSDSAQEVGVAELNGKIYVVGGFRDGVSVNENLRYDPQTNQWEDLPPLPTTDRLNHVGAATTGGQLYIIGGLNQSFVPVSTVYSFDPSTNLWSPRAPLPEARGAVGVAVIEGKIYVAGGLPALRSRQFTVYDPEADEWAFLPDMPTGREHLASAAIDRKFYAFSGRLNQMLTGATEIFDPMGGGWSTGAPIPTPRGGFAAAVLNGRAYVFGGEGNDDPGSGGVFREVEEFDPVTDSWRAMTPMSVGRHGIGAAVYQGQIYIPGGAILEGFGHTDLNEAFTPPPIDSDGDDVPDTTDNCTVIANPDQRDTNSDGYGNVCDPDLNNDGVVNFIDLNLIRAVFFGMDDDADFNGDGAVNFIDLNLMREMFFGAPGPACS